MKLERVTMSVNSGQDLLTIGPFAPENFSLRLNPRKKEPRLAATR
jgi:hypothetical protein